jgi:hypothetical protein
VPQVSRDPPVSRSGEYETQSVIFPDDWSDARCKAWLESHDYLASGMEKVSEHYRARQYDPTGFRSGSFRVLPIGDEGVRLVRGIVR